MGVFTSLKDNLKEKLIGAIKKGYAFVGSPAFISMRNKISGKLHPQDPPLFNGERHLITPDLRAYRWAGPNTNVSERLRRGGKWAEPINELDALAKVHDMDFMDSNMTPEQEWSSDKRLVDGALRLTKKIPEAKLLATAISGKMIANKTGALPWGTFKGKT